MPAEAKRLRGTTRPDRVPQAPAPAPDALTKLPLPPATLCSPVARAPWHDFGARLIAQGTVTSVDLVLLENLCEIVQQLQDVRVLEAGGLAHLRDARLTLRPFPQVAMERDLSRRLATRLADSGLTPGTRPRSPAPGAANPEDPMSEFSRRPT